MQVIATIKRGNEVVLQNVPVNVYVHTRPSGMKSWDGEFVTDMTTSFSMMDVGGEYTLVASDGRSGAIVVDDMTIQSSGAAHVHFGGSGPFK